jgi:hypothetical protein
MKIITKRIECLPVNGAPIDVPNAIHAVVTVLEPGTQLSTITSYLSKNQQDGEVRAMLAPELNLAQKLLLHKNIGTPAQACRILSRLVGLTSVVT